MKALNIPDNYDQFLKHDREEAKWLDSLPKCDYCGEPIQDDDLFDIDDVLYHMDCAKEEFMKPTENYVD